MLLPPRFLVRLAFPCWYIAEIPTPDADRLLDLPAKCRLEAFVALDGRTEFADVRLAWNEAGIAVQVEVRGKEQPPQGSIERPRASDGLTLWLDTRGDRTGHRATRTCHQFHFLPAAGGDDAEEPAFIQTKINRALQDAPLASGADVPLMVKRRKGGYLLEAFLPATVLTGFDPEEHPRLGMFYAVRDPERGEQTPGVDAEFPFAEDPSLWATLELVRG